MGMTSPPGMPPSLRETSNQTHLVLPVTFFGSIKAPKGLARLQESPHPTRELLIYLHMLTPGLINLSNLSYKKGGCSPPTVPKPNQNRTPLDESTRGLFSRGSLCMGLWAQKAGLAAPNPGPTLVVGGHADLARHLRAGTRGGKKKRNDQNGRKWVA